jgi:hypothetical protein
MSQRCGANALREGVRRSVDKKAVGWDKGTSGAPGRVVGVTVCGDCGLARFARRGTRVMDVEDGLKMSNEFSSRDLSKGGDKSDRGSEVVILGLRLLEVVLWAVDRWLQ